jgi:uncharacterized Zn-finger protein
METSQTPQTAHDDVVIVPSTRVMCEGSGGALGHPRTYLDMGDDTSVTCKYCDRVFKLDPNAVPGGHH